MASRLPKCALVALGLTVTLAMTALGGAALAGGAPRQANVNLPPASEPGSLRNESDEATDQSATEEDAVEPATDEDPAASDPSFDEPSADAEEEATDEPESE